jgi:hypothetical protein
VLTEWAEAVLPAFGRVNSPALWPTERSDRITLAPIDHRFAAYRDALGLTEGLDFHSLRRSYVTHLIEDGWDPLFKPWVDQLDIGHVVAHQARHTMATRLLRHGATLSHIRRYLGHVSDRMAEHYAKVAVSEIEDILQHVWVAGPGAPNPGELLSSHVTPLDRLHAEALALDLSRRSTPAEGGFCTFQPVVDGGACPWKLNCEGCDKFVMSGADLLYWRRKREQWNSIAERAPDDATADYLHQVFEPTARAVDGLEKALAGLDLLDDALALDLRRPQDYFHRLWNTGFRANTLAAVDSDDGTGENR